MFEQSVRHIKKICFIDDKKSANDVRAKLLKQQTYAIDYFPDADSGIAAFMENEYSLLIMELLDVADVIRTLRSVNQRENSGQPAMPLIIVTEGEFHHELLDDCVYRVLSKPFDELDLSNSIAELIPKFRQFGESTSASPFTLENESLDTPPMSMLETLQGQLVENENRFAPKPESSAPKKNVLPEALHTPLPEQEAKPSSEFFKDGRRDSDVKSAADFYNFNEPRTNKASEVAAPPKRSGSGLGMFGLVLFILLLTGGGYWYSEQQQKVLEVDVVAVKQGVIDRNIFVSGRVTSKRIISVSARAAGQVAEVRIVEGGRVKKGQIMIRLDDQKAENQIKQISAKLARSQEEVNGFEKTYQRLSSALEFGAVTRRLVEDAEAVLKTARARHNEIKQELVGAKVTFDYLQIKAPFSGVVGSVFVQEGQWLSQAEKVLSLIDVRQRVVVLPMDIENSERLSVGQKVQLSSQYVNSGGWEEKIIKISKNVASEETESLMSVHISLSKNLRIGRQVDVALQIQYRKNALQLPHHVLFSHQGSPHVALLKNGNIIFVPVVTGVESDTVIEIVKGLRLGQEVISGSSGELEPGVSARQKSGQAGL